MQHNKTPENLQSIKDQVKHLSATEMELYKSLRFHRPAPSAVGTVWECISDLTDPDVREESARLVSYGAIVICRPSNGAQSSGEDHLHLWFLALAIALPACFFIGEVSLHWLTPDFGVGYGMATQIINKVSAGFYIWIWTAALIGETLWAFGYRGK